MKILVAFFFVFATSHTFSCGNEYGHGLDGQRVFTQFFYLSKSHRTFDKEHIKRQLRTAQKDPNVLTDFKIRSNMGLYHMKLGEVDQALAILEPLYKEYPEEYIIVANLGTAYELDGQIDKALELIKKGYEINPNSHYKSEWIHIKILEAKIKEKKNPGWLKSNSILTTGDILGSNLRQPRRFGENHLEYQLRTRVAFTPAPNKVMANLLQTLAEYHVKHGTYENAIMAYTYVLEFSNSSVKKREISKAIVELNKKRRESGVSELHFMFKRLIEQGEIDPELMLYGVNELAEDLQQQDDKLASAQDSLKLLTAQVDSLKNLQPENSKSKNKTNSDSGMIWGIVFGLIGLIIGVIIASISIKRKNNSLKSDTFS